MMDPLLVLNCLKEIYGREGEDEKLLPLCEFACRDIETKVKKGARLSDIRLIKLACAMVENTFCQKLIYGSEGVTSFKAGDLWVNNNLKEYDSFVKENLEKAFIEAAPLLADREFAFRQVRV